MSHTPPPDTSAVQTKEVFGAIEQRTAHIVAQLRFAVRVLLKLPETPQPARAISIEELEGQAQHWQQFVPESADVRAHIAHRLSERFPLIQERVPKIVQALGLESPDVQAAYARLYGRPLESIYAKDVELQAETDSSPEDAVIRHELGTEMEWVFLPRGETLFRQGATGDSLYIVANGRLRIVVGEQETIVMELSSGDTVGEMGLISGEPRSATVYAMRDSELCRFSKAGFERLAAKHNRVMNQIALQMFERMRRLTVAMQVFSKPVMIGVLPLSPSVPIATFTERLTVALRRAGDTLHLSRTRINNLLPSERSYEPDDPVEQYELSAWLNEQEARYRFILLEAESTPSGWTKRCLHHADRVLLVGMADEPPLLSESERLLSENPRVSARKELVLLYKTPTQQLSGTWSWLVTRSVERHHHVHLDSANDINRIARFLLGRARALVLGGGGARGAAHFGVIRALEEAGVEIDLVGGTSAGAVVAALVAQGWDFQTIAETGRTHLLTGSVLLDYTLPIVSFTAGRRLNRAFNKVFEDMCIEDLPLPFFCVSANLSQAKVNVHRHGLLRRALRASSAIPGVYPPVTDEQGDLLVDGAVFNNLPADIAKSLCDGGTVIAVDVASTGVRDQPYELAEHLSGWRVLWNRMNPFSPKAHVPTILSILARTTILSSASTRAARHANADLLLTPPIDQFGLFEMSASEEMADVSYAYAREQIAAWLEKEKREI